MKRFTQILLPGLLLCLLIVVPASAEENAAAEVLPDAVDDVMEADLGENAPALSEASERPDPVFLAGSSAGGAGGLDTGLVNGESSNLPQTRVYYEDHFCCPYGATGCDCTYLAGYKCDPLACPQRTQPNCDG